MKHYDLAVLPDFATTRLTVICTIAVENPGHAAAFTFGLNPRFDSLAVMVDHLPVQFGRSGRDLTVPIDSLRRSTTIEIRASGKLGPSDDEERSVIGKNDLFLLWSDLWYPAARNEWVTARITLILPERFIAIAPGKEIERVSGRGVTRHVYEARERVGQLSVFADSRWVRRDSVVRKLPITLLLHPQSERFADTLFSSIADVYNFFSQLHGFRPFERFAFITQDSMFARRAYTSFIGYEPKWLEREMARTGYDAHETSLLWWGGSTRGRGAGAWQWTEGFGDYVEVLYSEARKLPLPPNFDRFRGLYLQMPFSEEPLIDQLNGATPQKVVHGKYPWLMHVLRCRIGDDAFVRGIRLLFSRYRYRTFTLDEFVHVFAESAGVSIDWWQKEWLQRAGVPDLALSYSLRPDGKRVRLIGSIDQQGNVYHTPLEIGIYGGASLQATKTVDLSGATTAFELDLEAEPDSIRLDPGRCLLARTTVKRK